MIPESAARSRVTAPLLGLAAGAATGGMLGLFLGSGTTVPLLGVTAALGAAALAVGIARRPGVLPMVAAGLALAFASGAGEVSHRAEIRAAAPRGSTVRAVFRVLEGWTPSRWGAATRIRLLDVRRAGRKLPLGGPARLEVRGGTAAADLPAPGCLVECLLAVRDEGKPGQVPFLTASSASLFRIQAGPRGPAAVREKLARRLFLAAGTGASGIRAAEIAGALALGRRDLVPMGVRRRWRASGLAHVLAVSGLHVGLVAGILWFLGGVMGLRPVRRRLLLLLAVPVYVLLAGAAPSAVRAGAMLEIYLLARLMGRHVVPLGAVLLAATGMILVRPSLLASPGFQLTVVITAALLRWTGPVAGILPLPRTISLAVAVPLVAQAAALPLVAWHFRDITLGAALTNLLALALLPPLVILSLAAVAAALVWPSAGGVVLSLVALLSGWTLRAGAVARHWHLTVPSLPTPLAALGLLALLTALLPGAAGRRGLAAFSVMVLAAVAWMAQSPPPSSARVTLLPVDDGASVLLETRRLRVLVDGGLRHSQADRLLADRHRRFLDAVVATHTDEDHIGGLAEVLARRAPKLLILPRWMLREPAAVPLMRAVRRRGGRVVPLVRGVSLKLRDLRLAALWPPLRSGRVKENDRSLVLGAELGGASALLPADTTVRVERQYLTPPRRFGLLLVPHHGSRSSCGKELLYRAHPRVALIPAGPGNRYHHPNGQTLARLRRLKIPFLVSRWDPWGAAELDPQGRWRLAP